MRIRLCNEIHNTVALVHISNAKEFDKAEIIELVKKEIEFYDSRVKGQFLSKEQTRRIRKTLCPKRPGCSCKIVKD